MNENQPQQVIEKIPLSLRERIIEDFNKFEGEQKQYLDQSLNKENLDFDQVNRLLKDGDIFSDDSLNNLNVDLKVLFSELRKTKFETVMNERIAKMKDLSNKIVSLLSIYIG